MTEPSLSEDSFYFREGYYKEMFGLRRQLSDVSDEALSQLAFALVKPDGVAAGKTREIVGFLRKSGLEIARCAPMLRPHPKAFEELYKFNLTLRNSHNQLGDWWLNSRVYSLGPSLALLLKATQFQDAHRQLGSIKGNSTPLRASPGTLRYDLAGTNQSMNLLHASDGPWSMLREIAIFVGELNAEDWVRRASHRHEPTLQASHLDSSVAAIDSPRVDLGFLSVMGRVLCAVVAVGCLEKVADTVFSLKEEADDSSSADQSTIFAAFERAAGGVSSALPAEADSDLLNAARLLARPRELTSGSIDLLIHSLDGAGIPTSEWERLVLRSTVHYRRDYELYWQ